MGVVMGTGYAGPGWEWPKAANWHEESQLIVASNGRDDFVVSGFPISTKVIHLVPALAPLWGASSKPHPMGRIFTFRECF